MEGGRGGAGAGAGKAGVVLREAPVLRGSRPLTWAQFDDVYREAQLVVVRGLHKPTGFRAKLGALWDTATPERRAHIQSTWGVEVADAAPDVAPPSASDVLGHIAAGTGAAANERWYCSFILQGEEHAGGLLTSLPYAQPECLPDAAVAHPPVAWVFVGRNTNAVPLQGRGEHTDSVDHDGTWHTQLCGVKRWRLRPNPDAGWPSGVVPTIDGEHLIVDVREGDFVAVNTRLWYHATELPSTVDAVDGLSISVARDFYVRGADGAVAGAGSDMTNVRSAWLTDSASEQSVLTREKPQMFVQAADNRDSCLVCEHCIAPVGPTRLQLALAVGLVTRSDVVAGTATETVGAALGRGHLVGESSDDSESWSVAVRGWDVYCDSSCASAAEQSWAGLVELHSSGGQDDAARAQLVAYVHAALRAGMYDTFILAARMVASALSSAHVSSVAEVGSDLWSVRATRAIARIRQLKQDSSAPSWWDAVAEDEPETEAGGDEDETWDVELYDQVDGHPFGVTIADDGKVASVDATSSAANAGVHVGDTVLSIAGAEADDETPWSSVMEAARGQAREMTVEAFGPDFPSTWMAVEFVFERPTRRPRSNVSKKRAAQLQGLASEQLSGLKGAIAARMAARHRCALEASARAVDTVLPLSVWDNVLTGIRDKSVDVDCIPGPLLQYKEDLMASADDGATNLETLQPLYKLVLDDDFDVSEFGMSQCVDVVQQCINMSKSLVGRGVYPTLGALAESDEPNCRLMSDGGNTGAELVLVTLREIRAGEFLTVENAGSTATADSEEESDSEGDGSVGSAAGAGDTMEPSDADSDDDDTLRPAKRSRS